MKFMVCPSEIWTHALVTDVPASLHNSYMLKIILAAGKTFNTILVAILCFLHQLNLGAGYFLMLFGKHRLGLINGTYCSSKVLRSPGCFARLLLQLRSTIKHYLRRRQHGDGGPAYSDAWRKHKEELLEFCGMSRLQTW